MSPTRRVHGWLGAILAASIGIVGCSSDAVGNGEETSFESAGTASDTGGDRGGADAGLNAPGSDSDGEGEERTVEEADIYRFEGDRLYVLNQFRGLFVFDVSDVDHPRQIGRLPLRGTPIEMYVRDGRAYAIISDYFDWTHETDGTLTPKYGSRIVGIDLTDPANPVEIGSTFLDGFVSDTRLVGDVIYAAANRWSWYGYSDSTESRDLLVLTSIDISNPASMREVQQLSFEGNGWYVQASPTAFVVAGSNWSSNAQTEVIYVDISSPTGEMAKRADLRVDGYIQDDTAINLYENQLRLLTRDWSDQTTKLRIFNADEPDTLPLLGELDYHYVGNVYGTTYDADRLYMIHYQTIDPLEVVDLSDPTHPFIAGILEMPGWVDRIAALGDRLIGLGIDDTEGREVSLTLFDVSDAANPRLLDRLNSGSGWSWTSASWERKAWTVDEESGVILFPYSSYSNDWRENHFALGIVEFTRDDLIPRGEVAASAPVERGALRDERVYALSQAALQVVDIRDRAEPEPTATIELARNLQGYARTSRVGIELITPGLGWYYYGSSSSTFAPVLRATDLAHPDSESELGRIELPRKADRIFSYGDYVVAINANQYGGYYGPGREVDADGEAGGDSDVITSPGITIVSFADPANPRIVTDFDLPETAAPTSPDGNLWSYASWQSGFERPFGSYQGGTPALDLGEGRFAFLRTTSTSCNSREACGAAGIEPTVSRYDSYEYVYGNRTDNALVILDLSASPTLSAVTDLPTGSLQQVFATNGGLFFTRAEPSRVEGDRSYVRNFFYRYSVSGTSLVGNGRVNVPGVVLSLSDDGEEAITLDTEWSDAGGYTRQTYALRGIEIHGRSARLASSLPLGGDAGNVYSNGNTAYVLRNPAYRYYYEDVATPGGRSDSTPGALLAVDAHDVSNLRVAHTEELGSNAYWSIYATSDATIALYGGYYRSGLALIDVSADPLVPSFRGFVPTNQQWSNSVLQDGSSLYLVNGPYGIEVVDIDN